jgi:hypothetical protein
MSWLEAAMTSARQIVATLLVFSFSPARPAVLGIVTHSAGASVGETDASEGTTVYEGDCLSTPENGMIGLRLQTANVQLGSQSRVTFRVSGPEKKPEAELASGTLVFSTANSAGLQVRADDALILPAENTQTIASVGVVSPKELRIAAARGSLTFSYLDESALIAEGAAYRVLLEPSDSRADSPAGDAGKGQPGKKPTHQHAFRFVLIGAAAGSAAWGVVRATKSPHQKHKDVESPDKP